MLKLYRTFSQAIGHMHAAAGSFVATQPRQALDTTVLIDEPALVAALLPRSSAERTWLLKLARIVAEVQALTL